MLNFALIGVGKWGKQHLKTLESMPDVNVKYLCSPNINRAGLSDKYVKLDKYNKLFKYNDIDGVIIATPPSTHYKISSDFLTRGYNVFVEKPMTTNYFDAIKLKKTLDAKNGHLMVGHIDNYNPAFLYVKENIKKIGKLLYIAFESGNESFDKKRISVLWDWCPHAVSAALSLTEQPPSFISAWSYKNNSVDETVYLNVFFRGNVNVFIKSSWLTTKKTKSCVVFGTIGSFFYDDVDKKLYFFNFKKNKKKLIKIDLSVPPLARELVEFKSSILQKRSPKTDINEALQVIKILQLSETSINRDGKQVRFDK